jgi:uncharacterized RmlC-like cupin family protein
MVEGFEKEKHSMSTASTPTCAVVRPGETYEGKQALPFFAGISAETVGATGICMHLVTISPNRPAKAHLHAAHETAFYVVQGALEMRFGERLAERLTVRAGEFLYVPAGMPHRPLSIGATEPCVAVVARTDPNEQESVILLPELESQAGD